MKVPGMNCAASRGFEAAQEIVTELKKKKNPNKYYDFVHDEFIDLTNNFKDNTPKKGNIKLSLLHFLKFIVISIFAMAVVIGGYWLLFRILS